MDPKVIFIVIVAVLAMVVTCILNYWFLPPPIPGSKDVLDQAQIWNVTGAFGPESIVFDINGEGPYTGVNDGRILKWEGEDQGWTEFAVTSSNRSLCVLPNAPELEDICGRPLGIRFDEKSGDLYIADAYMGLGVVGPTGGLATKLVTEVEDIPLRFTNDLVSNADESVIFFTDSSAVYQKREFMKILLTVDQTGRLMKYDKSTKEATVLLRNLTFANGIALSKDESFVLVAETTACRILRLWLQGPNAGQVETFAELPGLPDNIRMNSKGEFWVALHAKSSRFAKWLYYNPWAGKALLELPLTRDQLHSLYVGKACATAIRLSDNGEILEVLEDTEGKALVYISEAEEIDGKLWIGSLLMTAFGVYDL